MSEIIEIKNGLVSLIDQTVIKQINLRTFKEELLTTLGSQTPILPKNTILFAQRQDARLYLLEQPPQQKTIHYKPEGKRTAREYNIAMPFVYFLCEFYPYALESLYVYFSPKQLVKKSDYLYYPALPNILDECKACLGDQRFSITSSTPEKIAKVLSFYWTSNFNTEADQFFEDKMPSEIKQPTAKTETYFDRWSRIPAEKICRLSWHKYKPLEEILTYVLGLHG